MGVSVLWLACPPSHHDSTFHSASDQAPLIHFNHIVVVSKHCVGGQTKAEDVIMHFHGDTASIGDPRITILFLNIKKKNTYLTVRALKTIHNMSMHMSSVLGNVIVF